jgi:sugar lactone lactonase YvrE
VRFSAAGQKEKEWGGKGSEPGRFIEPMDVAVDATGQVYVCDNGNARLQVFNRDGQFLSQFPVPGWESKVYSEPHVTLDPQGTIWVTVPSAKEVRNYDRNGKLLRTITGREAGGAAFEKPMGIAYSTATHELMVTDLDNRLVRIPDVTK